MLESLRTFVGSWAAKILLVLLVGSFALWGISGSLLGQGDINTVATIGETKVPVREFLSAYQRNLQQVSQQVGSRLTREQARTFGVEQRSLNDVIAFGTLDEYAREAGLALSDETLARQIGRNPAFQDSTGTFSRTAFQQAVFQAQMRESDFIEAQNASSIRNQLNEGLSAGTVLPDAFADALATFANATRTFEYITLRAANVDAVEDPDRSALQDYFDANKAAYAAPEYRNIEILQVSAETIADESTVSTEDIAADYEARKASYETPEMRRVQQVVFADQAAADAAAAALDAGGIFESVMSDAGLTPADLGSVAKSALPSAIGKAAFALPLNEISDVIAGPFGPTIVRVTEITEGSTQALADVSADIRKDLALRAASDRVNDLFDEIEDARAGGQSLREIAAKYDLTVRAIPAVDRQGRDDKGDVITDIPGSRDVLARAFTAEVGQQGSPVDAAAGDYVWFDVMSIDPARDRTLDEVEQRVTEDWKADELTKRIVAKAEALKARLGEGTTLSAVASDEGVTAKTTDPLRRNGETEGFSSAAVQAGYNGPVGTIFTHNVQGTPDVILARVASTASTGEPVAADQMATINESARDDILNQLIGKLQGDYAVTTNPQVIDLALTRR